MATDFQNLADSIQAPTSVMSVEVLEDGSMGELRIVAGNRGYIDSIERPAGDYQMKSDKFIPGSVYTDYVPRDLNFEDFCFRSAVQKKCLHSYVKPSHMPVWFNMTFLPAGPPDGNIHYCTYTMEVNFEANTKRMSNVDSDLAKEVLETCIKLRGAKDFKATMQDVIVDLRNMSHAEQCSILLVDRYEKKTQVLCKDFSGAVGLRAGRKNIITPSSKDFYRITESWEELIGSSNMATDEEIRALVSPNTCSVLLAHHPERIEDYASTGVDLVLSGHAHGGQVRLFGQGLFSPDQGVLPRYTSGVYTWDRTKLYVSRGAGNHSFLPPRIFNRPEIDLITLKTPSR